MVIIECSRFIKTNRKLLNFRRQNQLQASEAPNLVLNNKGEIILDEHLHTIAQMCAFRKKNELSQIIIALNNIV